MNKRKAHILLSWLLLLFFVVGQFVIYAHQHHAKYNTLSFQKDSQHDQQVVHEKCNLCDQMHHAAMQVAQPLLYGIILNPVSRIYIPVQHHYKANALVHADGLSPPAKV